jgi:outer membrane protein assembly factor BamB
VTDGDRVFMVRQTQFGSTPQGSPVVAMDLTTGAELWAVHIPYETGDWTTWIAAAHSGLVFVSRAGNGSSVSAKMYALHQEDGSVAWASTVRSTPADTTACSPRTATCWSTLHQPDADQASDGTTAWACPPAPVSSELAQPPRRSGLRGRRHGGGA